MSCSGLVHVGPLLHTHTEREREWALIILHSHSQAVSTGWPHLLVGPGEPYIHPALSEVPQGRCGKP